MAVFGNQRRRPRQAQQRLARRAGAREAWPSSRIEEQQLCNIVQELAIASSMPAPEAMVLNRAQGINAFAAGWTADDAVIADTVEWIAGVRALPEGREGVAAFLGKRTPAWVPGALKKA